MTLKFGFFRFAVETKHKTHASQLYNQAYSMFMKRL